MSKTAKRTFKEAKEMIIAIIVSLITSLIASKILAIAGSVTMPAIAQYLLIFLSLTILIITPFIAAWYTAKGEIRKIDEKLNNK